MNILISGSSSGIGAGLARYLAKQKHTIILTFNSSEKKAQKVLQDVKKLNPNGRHLLSHLNVLDDSSIKKLAATITKELGSLDILISNAGIDYDSPVTKIQEQDWIRIFRTKIDGGFLMTQAFVPLLSKSNNAQIIFISASVGWKPDWRDPAYSAACAAVNNFSQSISVALSPKGIRSNVLCPGPVKTNLKYWVEATKENPKIWSQMARTNPLKRLCKIEDIGDCISYITKPGNYINGNIIYINGGAHLL